MTLGITNTFLGTVSAGGAGGLILLSATPAPSATVTTYGGYIVFKFTSSGTLNVGAGAPGTADVFVLGGGSSGLNGGQGPTTGIGGNGGAGGSRNATPAHPIVGGSPIPVTVGSSNTASQFGPLSSAPGTSGGAPGAGGTGPSAGYSPGSPGSPGPTNDYLTGSPAIYGGGGGGGGFDYAGSNINTFSPGGSGGSTGGGSGGRGAYTVNTPILAVISAAPGSAGGANTGGGGGGGGHSRGPIPLGPVSPGAGGAGGSGIVIARFPNTQFKV